MSLEPQRVVLVTGAGRGLGGSHARLLGRAGVAVVVNDVGSSLDGRAGDPHCADHVVEEIRLAGGTAVVSHHDVSTHDGAAQAVQVALDEFGRLDGLVNNAGILRDRTFRKMRMDDFDAVVRVHLGAAAYCTSAAWEALGASDAGRVVFTSSASGLYGQFGQANYASAKAAVVGMMNVLKLEGSRRGILVNSVAPVASTRMTQPLFSSEILDGLSPALISPVVAHLVSSECEHTGLILEVGAGFVARVQIVESETAPLAGEDGRIREVGDVIAELCDQPVGRPYASAEEALKRLFDAVGEGSASR